MTKASTLEVQRNIAKQRLFGARQALAHLVEMYDKGQWRLYYKDDAFAEVVREAKHAVENWTEVVSGYDRG
jgi:uncharacterized repeat protein (TIGR03809 family)